MKNQVTGPTDRASERIARARFAVHGTSDYPDATFSLRLSYGAVKGWTSNGQTIPPFTYFSGLLAARHRVSIPSTWRRSRQNAQNKVNSRHPVFDLFTDT